MSGSLSTIESAGAQPVVFGETGRQLMGWFHAAIAQDGAHRDCVVVMCNPIGYDAICTHRHYRLLAQQLSRAGFAVLRYDHHGAGDSSGSDEESQRIPTWLAGVTDAVAFAKTLSGASHASLFGVRFGGTLALTAAPVASSVVAWAPFPSGSLYLREMRALSMARDLDVTTPNITHDAGADLGEEAAGYLLTASTIAELGELSALTLATPPAPHILLMARDDIPASEKLARHLAKIGATVDQSSAPGYAGMMLDTFDAIVPTAALDAVTEWLSVRYPLQPGLPARTTPEAPVLLLGGLGPESAVMETPAFFGPGQRFFGMVSEPVEPKNDRRRTGVVFVNVGSNHHIGPNRMYVRQARALAALGFLAMRMDIGGVGESLANEGQRDNTLYSKRSVTDVQAAVAYLREVQQVERVVLVGVCSGAYLAFHSGLEDTTLASVVLINPQTFHWREGDSLALKTSQNIRSMRFYRSRLFTRETWTRLVTGPVNIRVILGGVIKLIWKRFTTRLASNVERVRPGSTATFDVRGAFRRLLKQGVNVYLIYSGNDGGLPEMGTHLGRAASSLRGSPQFKLDIVEGADHTFTPLWAQRRLMDLLTQHLMRLYG